jgi:hypothetical protein
MNKFNIFVRDKEYNKKRKQHDQISKLDCPPIRVSNHENQKSYGIESDRGKAIDVSRREIEKQEQNSFSRREIERKEKNFSCAYRRTSCDDSQRQIKGMR